MGYVATKSRPRYLDTDLKAEFAGDNPDYFDVKTNKWYSTSSGSELVTNGTFTSGTTGWTIGGTVTPTVTNGSLLLTIGAVDGYAYQYVPTVVGKKYRILANCYSSNNVTTTQVYQSTTKGTNHIGSIVNGVLNLAFTANDASTPILFTVGVAGGSATIDNISVFQSDLTIGSELTPRNYLNNIVYADHNGQPEYVEEVAKVEYKDIIKANEYRGKNACTAWICCNRTVPISIYDEYNIGSVVKINTGLFRIYFKTKMDNINYSIAGVGFMDWTQIICENSKALDYVEILVNSRDGTYRETGNINLIVFGGKN